MEYESKDKINCFINISFKYFSIAVKVGPMKEQRSKRAFLFYLQIAKKSMNILF